MEKSVKTMTADLAESSAAEGRYAAPTTTTERLLSEVLADIVGVERVSVDSHFFDDLGADSMVMARFCARVRKRADLPSVSMPEVYQHPTISSLATVVTEAASAPVPVSVPASTEVPTPATQLLREVEVAEARQTAESAPRRVLPAAVASALVEHESKSHRQLSVCRFAFLHDRE